MAMRRGLRRGWLPVVGACSLALGCAHNHPARYPPDPLLLSKKPVESRAESGPVALAARHEPRAPAPLASAEPPSTEGEERKAPVPALPASLHRGDRDEP
jgi:hypothetical protein